MMGRVIKIALSGQLYAKMSIKYFKELLKENYTSQKYNIELHYFGTYSLNSLSSNTGFKIIDHGYQKPIDLAECLKVCDFALLPYFYLDNLEAANQSFPSKLVGYLEASLPILYIGNVQNDVSDIINTYSLGITVAPNSNEINLDKILEALLVVKLNTEYNENRLFVLEEYFSKRNFSLLIRTSLQISTYPDVNFKAIGGAQFSVRDTLAWRYEKYKRVTQIFSGTLLTKISPFSPICFVKINFQDNNYHKFQLEFWYKLKRKWKKIKVPDNNLNANNTIDLVSEFFTDKNFRVIISFKSPREFDDLFRKTDVYSVIDQIATQITGKSIIFYDPGLGNNKSYSVQTGPIGLKAISSSKLLWLLTLLDQNFSICTDFTTLKEFLYLNKGLDSDINSIYKLLIFKKRSYHLHSPFTDINLKLKLKNNLYLDDAASLFETIEQYISILSNKQIESELSALALFYFVVSRKSSSFENFIRQSTHLLPHLDQIQSKAAIYDLENSLYAMLNSKTWRLRKFILRKQV